MTYNPITAGSVASSAYMNAALQAGIIRVADATALEATLTHSSPPAIGSWIYQEDTETIKRRAGSAFTDLLDVRRTRSLASPDLDFVDTAGTEQGTIRAAVASGLSTFTFLNPAGTVMGTLAQIRNDLFRFGGDNDYLQFGTHRLDILTPGRLVIGGADTRFTSTIINFQTLATIQIEGTNVGANKFLGTDASGRIAALTSPAGSASFTGLTDTPSALGSVGQSIRVATGGTALEFYNPTSGGATTFLGLADTPSAFTGQAGKYLVVNPASNALDFADGLTIGDDSITAAQARLDTKAHKEEWHARLEIPSHDTVGYADFNVFSGFLSSAGLVGFAGTQLGTINGSSTNANVRIGANLYSVTQIAQVITPGGSLNNIILRIGPDPTTDINGDWYFQVGGVFLSFANATKATIPGNRVTYTWTGSPRLFIGGQSTLCRLREPIADIRTTIPTNFSALAGTVAANQFSDNTIAFGRLIGGSLTDQAGIRTKAGFAALTNNEASPLFYNNNQVVQAPLSYLSLQGTPGAFPSALDGTKIVTAAAAGISFDDRLAIGNLPHPGEAGKVLQSTVNSWEYINTPTGGTGGVSSFAQLQGNLAYTQLPPVDNTLDGSIIGVNAGAWVRFQPNASTFFSAGTLPVARIPSAIPFGRLDLDTTSKQSAARTALGISTQGSPTNVASWAQTGNNDLIPKAKIPEEALTDLNAIRRLVLTTAHQSGGNRGFSRAPSPSGYGTLTNAAFTLDNQTITILTLSQIASGQVEVNINGTLPSDFKNDYALTITDNTGFVDILRFRDANESNEPGDTAFPSGLQSFKRFRWSAQNTAIIYDRAAGSIVNVALSAPLDDALEDFVAGIRQLPAYPTSNRNTSVLRGDGSWQQLLTDYNRAAFLYTLNTVQRPTQATQRPNPSALVPNVDLFSVSGNSITIRQRGLYIAKWVAEPRASNEGRVKVFFQQNNSDLSRSVGYFGDDGYGGGGGREAFHFEGNVNDLLYLEYEAQEVSPASGTAPSPISGTTATQYSSRNYTLISWTSPTANTYNEIHIRRRPAGQSGTEWGRLKVISANETNIRVPWLSDSGIDVQITLVNTNASTGGYSRTTTYLHSSGTFATETTRNQTVDALIDLFIAKAEALPGS